jgi:hypothetical protein
MARFIDTKDVAKIVRRVLKEAYPSFKFSVRIERYAGGSSIDVSWIDGPLQEDVNKLVGGFQGTVSSDCGDFRDPVKKVFEGEDVSFGNTFLFCKRQHSAEHKATSEAYFHTMRVNEPYKYFNDFAPHTTDRAIAAYMPKHPDHDLWQYCAWRIYSTVSAKGSVTATEFVLAQA